MEMNVRQISVFLEHRAGRMADVSQLLGENGVNIRAISLADTHDFGIVRLIVNDVDKALQLLRAAKFTVHDTEVVAISIPDEPGGLARTLNLFGRENLNVGYIYGFVERPGKSAILIFRFEEMDRAIEVIQANNLRLLSGEELYEL